MIRAGAVSTSTFAAFALWLALAGCASSSDATTTQTVHGTVVEHGRALFADPAASPSASNTFACATCHRAEDAPSAAPSTRLFPGAPLGGVTARATFWGGQRADLLASVNDCRSFFMDARAPWTADDEDARAMYAFLAQLAPATAPGTDPAPFTVVANAVDLPAGDAARGAIAYDLACKACHGNVHDGAGRLASFVPALPDDVVRTHGSLTPPQLRLVFVGKVRSGAFRGGGSMPPFSREVLADDDVAGLVAYLGLY